MVNRDAISLITRVPNETLLDFYNTIINYDIFIIVDNNDFDLSNLRLKFPKFNFVQINNDECIINGFQNILTLYFHKKVTGWDKVIYKMCKERHNYRYIWIVEDDVFIPYEKTLLDIDNNKNYESIDLISQTPYNEGDYSTWLWHFFIHEIKVEKPYYCGMMCAIRVTPKLLEKVDEYAKTHNSLFFLEAFFPTITKYYGLNCGPMIDEIKTIMYQADYEDTDIKTTNLYHPMKDIERHDKLRKLLNLS